MLKNRGILDIKKFERMYIPERDRSIVAKANPCISDNCSHENQVKNAFVHGFYMYHEALKKLSEI